MREEAVALARVEGANISEIARRFDVSRTTLYKWLKVGLETGEFEDRSRRPKRSPRRSSSETEAAVLGIRESHPSWGGRKIAHVLQRDYGLRISPSTVTEILRRHGCLSGPGAGQRRDWQRFERELPNELWQMDYKGHFAMLSGGRCHPFSCLDDHARYCLNLDACLDERSVTVQQILTRVFRRYGRPLAILCDNGGCWGANSAREITNLTVWLSRLDVELIHGRPYHPQTQGKQERFHRTLKLEVLSGRGYRDLEDCQRAFDRFRSDYNGFRPHESLGQDTPASRYTCSPRAFPEGRLPEPEYPSDYSVRKVQKGGIIHFAGEEFRVGRCLHGLYVGVRPWGSEDGLFEVRYGRSRIQMIDLR